MSLPFKQFICHNEKLKIIIVDRIISIMEYIIENKSIETVIFQNILKKSIP
ncbi:MAG: hypothetical protein Edafosvirus11_36, partial [Edafosvirus sp.]